MINDHPAVAAGVVKFFLGAPVTWCDKGKLSIMLRGAVMALARVGCLSSDTWGGDAVVCYEGG